MAIIAPSGSGKTNFLLNLYANLFVATILNREQIKNLLYAQNLLLVLSFHDIIFMFDNILKSINLLKDSLLAVYKESIIFRFKIVFTVLFCICLFV